MIFVPFIFRLKQIRGLFNIEDRGKVRTKSIELVDYKTGSKNDHNWTA